LFDYVESSISRQKKNIIKKVFSFKWIEESFLIILNGFLVRRNEKMNKIKNEDKAVGSQLPASGSHLLTQICFDLTQQAMKFEYF